MQSRWSRRVGGVREVIPTRRIFPTTVSYAEHGEPSKHVYWVLLELQGTLDKNAGGNLQKYKTDEIKKQEKQGSNNRDVATNISHRACDSAVQD